MEIIHKSTTDKATDAAFTVTYGNKSPEQVLQSMEKALLDQVGSVFSIIHGGASRKRRSNLLA